jgi:hypothetical protein
MAGGQNLGPARSRPQAPPRLAGPRAPCCRCQVRLGILTQTGWAQGMAPTSRCRCCTAGTDGAVQVMRTLNGDQPKQRRGSRGSSPHRLPQTARRLRLPRAPRHSCSAGAATQTTADRRHALSFITKPQAAAGAPVPPPTHPPTHTTYTHTHTYTHYTHRHNTQACKSHLCDGSVRGEEAGAGGGHDGHAGPARLVAVHLVHAVLEGVRTGGEGEGGCAGKACT